MKTTKKFTPSVLNPKPLAYAVALAMLQAGAAWAADGVEVEKVVVTANKRAQSLQDVPAALTVLSDSVLQRENVKGIDDLPLLAPAVTVSYGTQPGNFSINMRGVGTYSLGIGVESDVSVIVDDIPYALQASAFKDMTDVFRVEVLKGPQSTLFGKSSIAGALNISTRPLGGPMQVKSSVYYTSDKESRLSASVSGSVSDTFRMRLAASKTNFDGLVHNLADGSRLNGSKGQSLIGKFEWTPVEGLEIVASPRYNDTRNNCCVQPYAAMTPGGLYKKNPALPTSALFAGIDFSPSNVSVRNDYPAGGNSHDVGLGLKAAYTFGDGPLAKHTLAAIGSWSHYRMFDFQDGDSTAADVLQYEAPAGYHGGLYQYGLFDTTARTLELRLTSPDSGPLRYVAGLWYGNNDLARELTRAPITSYTTAYAATAYNTNSALFGQGSYDLDANNSVLFGLRYNAEKTGYTFTRFANPPAARTQTEYFSQDDHENKVTGRLGLQHKFDADTMAYGLYSTGHKGVAYDLTSGFTAATAKFQPVPGEDAKNYELGLKMGLFGNRAQLNVAVFRTDFKGFQQSAGFFDADSVFRTTLHSIGGLRTEGVEFDGNWRVNRALSLNGALGLIRATVREFENGPCYNVMNAAGTGTVNNSACVANPKYNNTKVQDLAGKTLPNAPKVKLSLGGQYDLALPNQSFDAFVTGSYRWQSKTQFNLNQDPRTVQGAYGIANLGVGIKDKGDRYKLSLFVNNLFDKLYANGLASSVGNGSFTTAKTVVNTLSWTPPRDYQRYFGVRLDGTFK